MLVRKDIELIGSQFGIQVNTIGSLIDTSKNEKDVRHHYEINGRYFLKIISPGNITEEKLKNIHLLHERYKAIGVYCPALIKGISGDFLYRYIHHRKECCAYLEEKAIYNTCDEEVTLGDDQRYQIVGHLGLLAKEYSNKDLVENRSMWSVVELSDYDQIIDEKEENFNDLVACLKKYGYKEEADLMIETNQIARKRIREDFDQLPKCVYQGDLNPSNILFDEKGFFAGLIDFNMFGTEVNINCFLNECMYYIEIDDFKTLSGTEIFNKAKGKQSQLLKSVFENYEMTLLESDRMEDYNKIIFLSFYPNVCLLIKLLNKKLYVNKVIEYLKIVCLKPC